LSLRDTAMLAVAVEFVVLSSSASRGRQIADGVVAA